VSDVQVAVLATQPGSRSAPRRVSRSAGGHPAVRLVAFAALGLYGALRWGTLLSGGATGRLLGLVALSTVVAALGPAVAARSRLLAGLAALLAAAAALAIAGVPVDWVVNLRVAVTARAIGDGLGTLPEINVPYSGVDQWAPLVILLGAAVLLLTGAFVFTFVPRQRGQLRLAGAALPLVTLAVIPATILRPAFPYVEGVLLFGLLVLFLWGDQMEPGRVMGVLLPCAVAGAVALAVGPSLDRLKPWINYRSLASGLGAGQIESFDWTQRYGPLHWPRDRRAVLQVQASGPEYWKAQNLDVFDGVGWAAGPAPTISPWQAQVSAASLKRWTQTIQVTLRAMSTQNVIAAGSAEQPKDVPGGAQGDQSPGTWTAGRRLDPGASYRVTVYSPHPTSAQMAAAGRVYPSALEEGYLSLEVPESRIDPQHGVCGTGGTAGVVSYSPGSGYLVRCAFPAFGTSSPEAGAATAAALRSSPYSGAFALSQRLARGASTPYAYVERVLHYLGHGFRYNEKPPAGAYPLEQFLVSSKQGYCQHFAGAMALLLRMGGVPARVAVGFTTGSYDNSLHDYTVIDSDAHAWVEAWFPHYGWVKFDPTPRSDPALGGHGFQVSSAVGLRPRVHLSPNQRNVNPAPSPGTRALPPGAGGGGASILAEVLAPVGGLALVLLLALRTIDRSKGDPVAELSRAFARTGRPLRTQATLAALEQRLAGTPDAAAYVRSLRLARFASQPELPSLRRRRAFRRALADGLGITGRARALWAVPPRWRPPASWRRLNWMHGRRVRALSERDGAPGGGAQSSGHDPAEPSA
jgi:hypothetical protein